MKLPKDVKKRWLKALRSGEYKQAHGTLHDPETGGFCCLGVLECESMDGEVEAYKGDYNRFKNSPSMDFWNYIGAEVKTEAVDHPDDSEQENDPDVSKLMTMNDGVYRDGHTGRVNKRKFTTIANWIEKHIEVIK